MDKELPVIPCNLIIENAESKEEIIACLDSFLSSNKYRDNYTINQHRNSNSNNNSLSISLSNSKIGYEFLQEITYKKYNKKPFMKINAQLVFANVNNEHRRSQSEKVMSIASKDRLSQRNENNQTVEIDKYFTKKTPIRITSPYIDQQKKLFMEYQKNKNLWVHKKPFFNSVNGKALSVKEEIGTYVHRAPPNSSVVNYKHREENKAKWIKKSGFLFKKAAPDYIG